MNAKQKARKKKERTRHREDSTGPVVTERWRDCRS